MSRIARLSFIIIAIVCTLALFSTSSIRESFAQARPALVRNVDEPARVPYYHSVAPTCPYVNECLVTFPAVPANKRLHLTAVMGFFRDQTAANGFVALSLNTDYNNLIYAFPVSAFSGAYFGNLFSFNQQTDLFFEAEQSPVVQLGVGSLTSISVNPLNRVTVSGYLVDVLP
jgi:hypothetical protein